MTYYCLPPMLHELALVGGENVFESLATERTYIIVGNQQCDSIEQQLTNTISTVLA